MIAGTHNNHQIRDGDFRVMLDSLQELFQENGNAVTPKQLATRMEQKLHRHVHYSFATYLFTLLGFTTRLGIGQENKSNHYIVFNAELFAEKQAYFSRD